MSDEYLFISDCHLDNSRPDITSELTNFLQNRAIQARFLYILGDLFEAWIGDDDTRCCNEIFDCFSKLSQNTEIFFLPGNRDFLFGEQGARRMQANIIPEPTTLLLGGKKVALLHGDSMCTDDLEYQQFRKKARGDAWQSNFLANPLSDRVQLANELREQSKAAMRHKPMDILDVNHQSVIQHFEKLGVDSLIHGHTHRPAIHHYDNNLTRYVLGDWNPQRSYLSWRIDRGFVLTDRRVQP